MTYTSLDDQLINDYCRAKDYEAVKAILMKTENYDVRIFLKALRTAYVSDDENTQNIEEKEMLFATACFYGSMPAVEFLYDR